MSEEIAGGSNVEMWLSRADETGTQSEIQRRVWEEIGWEPLWEPLADADALRVDVASGVVTLTGALPSYAAKRAVGRAAARVAGVRDVVNAVRVELPPAQRRSDGELADVVVHTLQWDVVVPDRGITVTVTDGCVTLEGVVSREDQREAAELAVSVLAGVRDVRNALVVRAPGPVTGLGTRVEAALRRDSALQGRRIRATTDGGVVVLHGRVRSLAERVEAEHAVWTVPGVLEVEDRLEIQA